jgi:hypothetical protein
MWVQEASLQSFTYHVFLNLKQNKQCSYFAYMMFFCLFLVSGKTGEGLYCNSEHNIYLITVFLLILHIFGVTTFVESLL